MVGDMDKIEARKALNRLQVVCKRLQARLKNGLFVPFSKADEICKVGEDASDLLCYCQITKDKQIMAECAMIPRYLFSQYVGRVNKGGCNDVETLQPLNRAVSYLLEVETLYICTCFRLTEQEACKYYIDKVDGLCKNKKTKEEITNKNTDVYGRAERANDAEGESTEETKFNFVPVKHREEAKATFARLLADGWVAKTTKGYQWRQGTTKALRCFFADLANDKWKLRGSKSMWKPFAELFGMESKDFVTWKSDQMNHTGTEDPKGADEIKKYFE